MKKARKRRIYPLSQLAFGTLTVGMLASLASAHAEVSSKGLRVGLSVLSKCKATGTTISTSTAFQTQTSASSSGIKIECSNRVPYTVSVARETAMPTQRVSARQASSLPVTQITQGSGETSQIASDVLRVTVTY